MRYSCYKSVEYDLKLHYKLLDKYTKEMNELSAYEGYVLKPSKVRGSKRYYSAKGPGMSGFHYTGNDENEQQPYNRRRSLGQALNRTQLDKIQLRIDITFGLLTQGIG